MTREEAQKAVERHIAQLGELFDSVAIVCTYQGSQDGKLGTAIVTEFAGNFYAAKASLEEASLDMMRTTLSGDDEDDD